MEPSEGQQPTPNEPPRATRWLADDFSQLLEACQAGAVPDYDLVIVGSGYGGAVAAAELSGLKDAKGEKRVCVLERGREYLPGSFPSRWSDLVGQVRFSSNGHPQPRGPREGLFDFRIGDGISALVANGVGGGSLINGAVMEVPDFATFESRLPAPVLRDLGAGFFAEVKQLLGAAARQPDGAMGDNNILLHPRVVARPLPKREALNDIARAAGTAPRDAALTIEMQGSELDGVELKQCALCGDCMTGCNVGAKRSLDTNLLVRARRRGAEIYSGASVLQVAFVGDAAAPMWQLEVVHTDKRLREKRGPAGIALLRTRKLILAAGTFGSTEILLRSQKERGLLFSPQLGSRFSGNGDNLVAVTHDARVANTVGCETDPLLPAAGQPERHVGPTITGVLPMASNVKGERFLVQEFAVPAPMRRLVSELVTTGRMLQRLGEKDKDSHDPSQRSDPLAVDPAAIARTSLLGLIGHDNAQGTLALPAAYSRSARSDARQTAYEGGLRFRWPDAAEDTQVNRAFSRFEQVARKLGAVVPNPMWQPLPESISAILSTGPIEGALLTVHPLGGCAMGASWNDGVVDEHGAVFDFERGRPSPWQGSLIVLDGSIVPGSLGANPALTIAALALRAARHWRKAWGWDDAGAAPRQLGARPVYRLPQECTKPAAEVKPTQVEIIERLFGEVQLRRGSVWEPYIAELTLGFEACRLAELNRGGPQVLSLVKGKDTQAHNKLRLYPKSVWDARQLHAQDDDERIPHAVLQARLKGELRLLHREASTWWGRTLRGIAAYALNRGVRDTFQHLQERSSKAGEPGPSIPQRIKQAFTLATHAAEVRRFDYDLQIDSIESAHEAAPALVGTSIHGVKRFTYECRSNPWNQLLYLSLEQFPGQRPGPSRQAPKLKLDAAFLANRGVPLLRITEQEDQPSALGDLVSFGAYWLRLMVSIHVWNFRAPDSQSLRRVQRLPGALAGLPPPEIQEILLRSTDKPVRVRLTRYRGTDAAKAPLVMIHGYSASGTTFAHPALKPSMAEHFWKAGRDIWILDLRTSAGMPTADLPWTFEQVARADIPMAIDRIVKQVAAERQCDPQLVQVDVFAHCIGAVMLSMALLSKPPRKRRGRPLSPQKEALHKLPGRIRRVVLSQKGFALQYSIANVLRAYVLRYLKPLLLPKDYKFRPSPVAPSNKEQLLDRFLYALPYPVDEFRRENPLWPCKRVPWVATRHRMDALYERTFSVNNMSDEVLAHIDDFFGPLSTETVSQTIHFARYRTITNQYGRNIFVTSKALLNWPKLGTMSIHAKDNGMVDPYTQTLMREAMNKAGVPFYAAPMLEGGHQDCLIGMHAEATFRQVQEFLDVDDMVAFLAERGQPAQQFLPRLRLEPPWLGPRLHRTPTIMQRYKAPNGPSCAVAGNTVQLLLAANPAGAQSHVFVLKVRRAGSGFELVNPPAYFNPTAIVPVRGWFAVRPKPLAAQPGEERGYLVLVNTPYAVPPEDWQLKSFRTRLPPAFPPVKVRARDMAEHLAARGSLLGSAFVSLADVERARRGDDGQADQLRLLVASCQYPAGILDAAPARLSLERMKTRCTASDAPDAVLMVGDQIYADASAGLLDPTRLDDKYGKSYEAWLSTEPLREIMRRVPVHMTLDDHEIMDNWEPGAGSSGPDSSLEEARNQARVALREYWYYQRAARPSGANPATWYRVMVNGFEVFMADTRSQRHRGPDQLIDSTQWQALDLWLNKQRDDDLRRAKAGQPHPRPKFLACGSWLAPRRLGAAGKPEVASRCDGWEAFPAEAVQLLQKIADGSVRGLVLLAGDAHLGCWAELVVRRKDGAGARVPVICIYAPAMYAPFPFANGRRQDFIRQETLSLDGTYVCDVTSHWPEAGDGFTEITAALTPDGWKVGAMAHAAPAGPPPATSWLIE